MAEPGRLRAEVDGLVEAITGALVDWFGDGMLGMWCKGSAAKPWDSAIDYVPELSDVDIHDRADAVTAALLADLDTALGIHADIERRFTPPSRRRCTSPGAQFVPTAAMHALPGTCLRRPPRCAPFTDRPGSARSPSTKPPSA